MNKVEDWEEDDGLSFTYVDFEKCEGTQVLKRSGEKWA